MRIENTSNLAIGQIVVIKNDGWVYLGEEKVQEHSLNIFTRRDFYHGVVKEDHISPVLYADLHRHSGYSLLDGAIKIKDMAKRTELYGALTDHGNMFGFLSFYSEMKKQGKKPIVGCEVYVETVDEKKESHHLILLVKNEEGYKNLIKLVSDSYDNVYKKPHVSLAELKKHRKGLICTSACLGGEIAQSLLCNNINNAENVANIYKQIFGDDFYIEIQRHNFLEEKETEVKLIKLAKKLNIKIIATTDAHYPTQQDEKSHEILLCIQTKKTLTESHWTFPGEGYYIHTSEEMYNKFKDIPEALDNTLEIAEKVNFEIKSEILLPEFPLPDGVSSEVDYFEQLCRDGFKQKYPNPTQEYIDRIEYEIRIIKNTGYCGYFLIVQDYINWAKNNDILVGPGRGSCVGSLASYCLGITDLDPIPYGLLFERFLNPERISMPDIDTDFQEDKRDLVIEYVRNKYGVDSVAKIITFGTLAAKVAIKDVARVQGHDFSFSNKISKLIPNLTKSIDSALEESGELKELYETNNEVSEVIDVAKTLEGLQRHSSIHACGVVIAPQKVETYIPTIKLVDKQTKVRETVTQLTMSEVEEMGLLKMDVRIVRC